MGNLNERLSGNAQETRVRLLSRFRSLPSPLIRVQRFGHPPLSGTERDTLLQMEISLININVPYKTVVSTWFSELFLCLLFLKK